MFTTDSNEKAKAERKYGRYRSVASSMQRMSDCHDCKRGATMLIDINSIFAMKDANLNFSKVCSSANQYGLALIFKNSKPKYLVISVDRMNEDNVAENISDVLTTPKVVFTLTEANQNFSQINRALENDGKVLITGHGRPKYYIVAIELLNDSELKRLDKCRGPLKKPRRRHKKKNVLLD